MRSLKKFCLLFVLAISLQSITELPIVLGQSTGQPAGPVYGPVAPNRGAVQGPQAAPNSATNRNGADGYRTANTNNAAAPRGPASPPGAVVPAGAMNNGPPNAAPLAPSWIPLPAEHEKHIDQVLAYWQAKSGEIKRYRCSFTRWQYDPTFVAPVNGELPAKSRSSGVLMYEAPDKGLFREDVREEFVPPQAGQTAGSYKKSPPLSGDHWVCNGKSILIFEFSKQQVIEEVLPQEMQGKAIIHGPLPFMFGADAATMKQRFWFRALKADQPNEYHLEAVPKTREDAANFKSISIIIDGTDFLPKAMAIYDRGPSYQSFMFAKRETNWSNGLNPFAANPFAPAVPQGWTKVVNNPQPAGPKQAQAPNSAQKR